MVAVSTFPDRTTDTQRWTVATHLAVRLWESQCLQEALAALPKEEWENEVDQCVARLMARMDPRKPAFVRRVQVKRHRAAVDMLRATKFALNLSKRSDVLATLPQAEGNEVDLYFFPPHDWTPKQAEEVLAAWGKRSDPYAQAAAYEADQNLARLYPSISHWSVAGEESNFMVFSWGRSGREVVVGHSNEGHGGYWLVGASF